MQGTLVQSFRLGFEYKNNIIKKKYILNFQAELYFRAKKEKKSNLIHIVLMFLQ